jgi:hypothetical protein
MTVPVAVRHEINEAILSPVDYRRKCGMNQSVFWGQFGVTQSAGSRYETHRDMPSSLKILIALKIAGRITDTDLEDAEQFYK